MRIVSHDKLYDIPYDKFVIEGNIDPVKDSCTIYAIIQGEFVVELGVYSIERAKQVMAEIRDAWTEETPCTDLYGLQYSKRNIFYLMPEN